MNYSNNCLDGSSAVGISEAQELLRMFSGENRNLPPGPGPASLPVTLKVYSQQNVKKCANSHASPQGPQPGLLGWDGEARGRPQLCYVVGSRLVWLQATAPRSHQVEMPHDLHTTEEHFPPPLSLFLPFLYSFLPSFLPPSFLSSLSLSFSSQGTLNRKPNDSKKEMYWMELSGSCLVH